MKSRPIAVAFGILAFGFTLWSVGKCKKMVSKISLTKFIEIVFEILPEKFIPSVLD